MYIKYYAIIITPICYNDYKSKRLGRANENTRCSQRGAGGKREKYSGDAGQARELLKRMLRRVG